MASFLSQSVFSDHQQGHWDIPQPVGEPMTHHPYSSAFESQSHQPYLCHQVQTPPSIPADAKADTKADLKWQCEICDVKTRNEPDWMAHLASKEHLKRVQEREQCAVLVQGLPLEAGIETVQRLLSDFQPPYEDITFVPSSEIKGESHSDRIRVEAFWHVQLQSIDDARRAVKNPERIIDGYNVTLTLAIHPFHCSVCHMSLNSAKQFEQHIKGAKHKEVLKQHVAQCGLMIAGLPWQATEQHVRQLFKHIHIPEGGILLLDSAGSSHMQTAHVTFNSKHDADHAFELEASEPTILGAKVHFFRQIDPKQTPKSVPEIPIAGEKTPEEAVLLARSFLHSRKVKDINLISSGTFARVFTIYLSSKPSALPGVLPKDRFFEEFDAKAGGKRGTLTLEQALTMIQPIEQDFNFELPDGVCIWLHEKLAKYYQDSLHKGLSKGTFVQVRNLLCNTYQCTNEIMKALALNQLQPPPSLQFPPRRHFPSRQQSQLLI